MEASIFKFVFFIIVGLAILGLSGMVIAFTAIAIKGVWQWLKAPDKLAKRHA
jgi:hypothetical protein